MIQLRDKNAPAGEFYSEAIKAIDYAHQLGTTIIVNDRVDIALTTHADGVHLGQDDLPPAEARNILGPDAIIGFSTHSVEQAVKAMALPIDYIAIGPIFATSTKSNPDAVVGLDGLRALRSATGEFPLVAIGGIDRANINSVLGAGADSVSMISGLLSDAPEIADRLRGILTA
jgi:thiamine-phosphate pyrophosphorylase